MGAFYRRHKLAVRLRNQANPAHDGGIDSLECACFTLSLLGLCGDWLDYDQENCYRAANAFHLLDLDGVPSRIFWRTTIPFANRASTFGIRSCRYSRVLEQGLCPVRPEQKRGRLTLPLVSFGPCRCPCCRCKPANANATVITRAATFGVDVLRPRSKDAHALTDHRQVRGSVGREERAT